MANDHPMTGIKARNTRIRRCSSTLSGRVNRLCQVDAIDGCWSVMSIRAATPSWLGGPFGVDGEQGVASPVEHVADSCGQHAWPDAGCRIGCQQNVRDAVALGEGHEALAVGIFQSSEHTGLGIGPRPISNI